MSRPLQLVLALIALAAIALPAWAVIAYRSTPDIPRLEAMAERACKCERATGASSKATCWTKFEAAAGPRGDGEASLEACAPLAKRYYCLKSGHCVVTGYKLVVRSDALFCTRDEARAAEAAYENGAEFGDLERMAHALAVGGKPGPDRPAMGCTSGVD